jgi:alkanesulfonate monooxygenase SsuD/methylene tetrahydromethanopterin reductase-like flavin-dependent oxidoreductase (luciferase family)
MTLLLGAHVGQQNFEMDDLRALWRWLDGSGFDWISAWDHLYEAPPSADPRPGTIPHFEAVATLAALAVETTNARLGCLVFYVGYRNPGLLAKAAITIDHLAGGRFELGIGAGWHQWEAEAYGYDFPPVGTRLDMLDEAARLIGPLIRSGRFPGGGEEGDGAAAGEGGDPVRTTFEGEHFRLAEASCLPPPPLGGMPLWIGGVGERRTLPMAARYADGWNAAYISAAEFGRLDQVLTDRCQDIDRDPADIERSVNLVFAMGADEARARRAEEDLAEQWGPMVERIRGGALTGTPAQAVEQVLAYAEAGAGMVNIALRSPFDQEALEAYQEAVMPEVRAATGG